MHRTSRTRTGVVPAVILTAFLFAPAAPCAVLAKPVSAGNVALPEADNSPAVLGRLARKKKLALAAFAKAERMREALNGRPASERRPRDYQQVIEAYRRVYYLAPTSPKADPSVVAVAELMVESGRAFKNPKSLRAAIGQYQFLRREYPGSKYRFEALFTIAQIYNDDLEDAVRARATFQEFLKRYPRHPLAEEARNGIAALDQQARDKQDRPRKEVARKPQRVRVTGVRHWSTPDYTRVAIDLEDEVKYESARVDSPDRIYFDLHGTRLASVLVGKTFDVEDGLLRKIRVAQYQAGETRIVLDLDEATDYSAFLLPNPYRLIVDIRGKRMAKAATPATAADKTVRQDAQPAEAGSGNSESNDAQSAATAGRLAALKTGAKDAAGSGPELKPAGTRGDTKEATAAPTATLDKPETGRAAGAVVRIDDSVVKTQGKRNLSAKRARVHQARPTANGERSLIRALGLKIGRIVVDAGHGGHDTGTIAPNGLLEKDLVLDVALRLGKLLDERMGAEVVYTRDDDTFIPLETRTAIANQKQADLFISIHANSSPDPAARGVETYYLNFSASDDALEVAARENAVSDKSIHELQDLVKKITLKDKIEESREFAAEVQRSLHAGLFARTSIRDRGVRKAPFIVLIGANMPSILAEISFVSNPTDARKLSTAAHRQKIAEALYRGIARYVGGLSGVKVANNGTQTPVRGAQ